MQESLTIWVFKDFKTIIIQIKIKPDEDCDEKLATTFSITTGKHQPKPKKKKKDGKKEKENLHIYSQ